MTSTERKAADAMVAQISELRTEREELRSALVEASAIGFMFATLECDSDGEDQIAELATRADVTREELERLAADCAEARRAGRRRSKT